MKILGIESSSLVASVAICDGGIIKAEYTVNHKKTHSQTLLPMLDEIVRMTDEDIASVDAIAISAGPGSFTGLRIGAATAKGLCLAMNKPLIAVPTLDATAYNISRTTDLICPIMDARRAQVYNGLYYNYDKLDIVKPSRAMDIHELIEELNSYNETVVFLGDGVPVYKDVIEAEIKCAYAYAPSHSNRQRAASVAALGEVMLGEGLTVDSDTWAPEYLRQSQAERERDSAKKVDE